MARKNIFELLAATFDMAQEVSRLDDIIRKRFSFVWYGMTNYTLERYVDEYCFSDWESRGHFLDLSDFLNAISYTKILTSAKNNPEAFLTFIEIGYNLYYLAKKEFLQTDDSWECYDTYEMFPQIADDCLAHFNHKIFYNEELEQAIVVEDKPEVTAVVEIEEDTDIAFEIVRYNHHALKGDISAKRAILLKIGSQLEPLRSQISACNKTLEKDIFFMLNNLNIRHNNCVPGDAKYKPFVASMDAETLENWYDELYQMILLAKLELANVKRMEQVETLKQNIK